MTKVTDALFLEIAQKHVDADLETLETRGSDALDFVETSVAGIKAMLEAAYKAGASRARSERAARKAAKVPAPKAPIRIRTSDEIGNVSFVYRDALGAWRCVLANGMPAGLEYAGVSGDRVTECRFALENTTTAADALAVLRRYVRRALSVV